MLSVVVIPNNVQDAVSAYEGWGYLSVKAALFSGDEADRLAVEWLEERGGESAFFAVLDALQNGIDTIDG